MPSNFQQLTKQYHAFYEVSPHYVVLEERPLGLPATTRRVHAGFNVDVYGIRPEDNEPAMPPPHDYAQAYADLKKLAESVSQHTTNSCTLDVIALPSTAIIDSHGKVEAMLRITISHERGLDQPAGAAEQRALEEVEHELKAIGVAHR